MRTFCKERTKTVAGRAALTLLVSVTLSACSGPMPAVQGQASQENQVSSKKGSNGIEVIRIGHAVNGMMLDLRYRITDFALARQVLKQNTPLSIVDQATGTVLAVAKSGKVGALRNVPQNDDPGKVYWMFFANTGGLVKAGGSVTVVIGDVRIKDLTVE